MERPVLTRRLSGFGTSIFAEMTALARQHDAVNLGQGFPSFDGPEFVKRAAVEALAAGHNQYSPMPGLPALQQAVADAPAALLRPRVRRRRARSRSTRARPRRSARRSRALLDAGDEAIVFEPFYDAYQPGIALAQAQARVVPLAPPVLPARPRGARARDHAEDAPRWS